jgi:peptidyl-prolyl cis-trans isomerase SurA
MILALLLAAAGAPAPAPASPPPAAARAATAAPAAPGRVLDRVAAVVNGDVITLVELEERAGPDLRRAEAEPAGPARERARTRVLQQAFEVVLAEKLFAAQVAALGVEVSEAEVAAYRKAVKRDLESMRIVQLKIRSKVKVSDEDVQHYWQTHPQEFRAEEEVQVRHIFLALKEDAVPAEVARVRERAEKIVARLRHGDEFGLVARQVSEGPSASDGGELGWLRRGTVQADVEKVAFGLQTGQISDPVQTRSGFQILQVEARRGGGARPLAEVKEEIRDKLTNEQGDRYRTQFIAELKKDAVIDVKMPELKAVD